MRVVVVDDEPAIRFSLSELLEADGHDVRAAEHAPAALALLEQAPADLVLTDLRMPKVSGLELLAAVRAHHPDVLVVLVTAHGDERTAVRALREGAYDYLPKPFDNDEVRATVRRAHEVLALRSENARLRDELAGSYRGLIGDSPALREVQELVARAAPTDVTVLVTGESGTGKELVARALHAGSRRARRAFLALNCAALPAELAEAELFGHVKGAFTGAGRDREGLFEAADGGTLFLDEVGDLAPAAQAKLLRVLETREVTRVGDTRAQAVDVRVIAATNRPLAALERDGRFRADLRYRLEVLTIALPPLRNRREDVLPLAVHFLARAAELQSRRALALSEPARAALLAHDWPGNVRELRNAMERALVVAAGPTIELADLPQAVSRSEAPPRSADAFTAALPLGEARRRAHDSFDREYLEAALARHDGNVSRTAQALGVHRQSLQKMLRRIGL